MKCTHINCYCCFEVKEPDKIVSLLRCLVCNERQDWSGYEYFCNLTLYDQSRKKEFKIYSKLELIAEEETGTI